MDLRERLIEGLSQSETRVKEESVKQGKELRTSVPRESHAAWTPAADRPDPVELLRSQGETRVQALLPLRYERMSASAFTFYRGGALIMASDLSKTPRLASRCRHAATLIFRTLDCSRAPSAAPCSI